MHRFFVPPHSFESGKVTFTEGVAHQIRNVLRMQPGERLIVLDDSGLEYVIALTRVGRHLAQGEILERRSNQAEPRLRLRIYQSLLKPQRFEWLLQKGTELGAAEIIPLITERTLVREVEQATAKAERWQAIVREAAEQCGRGRLLLLRLPMLHGQACQHAQQSGAPGLILWEEERTRTLGEALGNIQPLPASLNLFIGPEGGFTAQEVRAAQAYGMQSITLGPRTLRAETAALAATAIILHTWGEMRTPTP